MSTTGSVDNPWRYASGYLDSSTGLYKFGARYDDPTIGRWTQQDPLAGRLSDPTSLNRYGYAEDDPVNLVDPSGKLEIEPVIAEGIVIGFAFEFTQNEALRIVSLWGLFILSLIVALATHFNIPLIDTPSAADLNTQILALASDCGSAGVRIEASFRVELSLTCGKYDPDPDTP